MHINTLPHALISLHGRELNCLVGMDEDDVVMQVQQRESACVSQQICHLSHAQLVNAKLNHQICVLSHSLQPRIFDSILCEKKCDGRESC